MPHQYAAVSRKNPLITAANMAMIMIVIIFIEFPFVISIIIVIMILYNL